MNHGRLILACIVSAACFSAAALPGCASSKAEAEPAIAPGDNSAMTKDRLKAIAAVEAELRAGQSTDADLSATRESLKKAIWSRSSVTGVRIAALNALLADERNIDDTRHMLSLMIPTESASREWDMLDRIGEIAGERGWTDLAPALVVSWSRVTVTPSDDKRPERRGLELLYPGRPVEDAVFDVFVHAQRDGLDEREQMAAWALLRRIDRGRTVDLVRALDADGHDSRPVRLLARGARELGVVPDTADQFRWLERLAEPVHADFWSQAAGAVARLSDDQRAGLELRHLAGIVLAASRAPDRLTLDTDAAIRAVAERLDGVTIYRRSSSGTSRFDESIRTAKGSLVWGDAISILAGADAIADPAVVAALFTQADEDRRDTSTEYGGAIDALPDGSFVARSFPPRPTERINDRRFVASLDLLLASDASLFHYHFHAASARNSDFAGPSDADIKYAAEHGRCCLVLTSLSDDRLDVDWYRGNGAIIDLGAIRRPGTQ